MSSEENRRTLRTRPGLGPIQIALADVTVQRASAWISARLPHALSATRAARVADWARAEHHAARLLRMREPLTVEQYEAINERLLAELAAAILMIEDARRGRKAR